MRPSTARLLIGGVAVSLLVVDVVTKMLAVEYLDPQRPVPLLGGLVTLRLLRNPGAAFSMGENATLLFSLLAVVTLAFVLGWLAPRVRVRSWAVATGLLVAGVAGNLIDRLFRAPGFLHGHVVDFISLPYFAVFNVADMCLTAAAVLIVWLSLSGAPSYDGTTRETAARDSDEQGGTDGPGRAHQPGRVDEPSGDERPGARRGDSTDALAEDRPS